MGDFGSGRRSNRWASDDCVQLRLSTLRRDRALQRGVMARREHRWHCGDGLVARLTIITDADCLEPSPCLRIEGTAFGRQINQYISLESQPLHFGGERWYALCPLTGRRCTTLVLPPDKQFFASTFGWRIPYSSQREGRVERSQRAIDKLEARNRRRSKYTRKPTRERLWSKLEYHQEIIEEDIYQLRLRIFGFDGAAVG